MILIVVNLLYYRVIRSALVDMRNTNVANSVHSGIIYLDSDIKEKINETRLISQMPSISNTEIDIETKLNYLQKFQEEQQIEDFCIADERGRAISIYNESMDISNTELFKNAFYGLTYVSEPYFDNDKKNYTIAVSTPIRNNDGNIYSVLVEYYSMDDIERMIGQLSLNGEAISFITSEDGAILFSSSNEIMKYFDKNGNIDNTNADLASLKKFEDTVMMQQNIGKGSFDFLNTRYYASYEKVSDYGWYLVLAIPYDILYSDINIISDGVLFATIAVIVILAAFSVYTHLLKKRLTYEKSKGDAMLQTANLFIMTTNNGGVIMGFNENIIKALGYTVYELDGSSIFDFVPERVRSDFMAYIKRAARGEIVNEIDIPLVRKDKSLCYILWNCNRNENENMIELELIGTSIDRLKDYEQKVQRLAYCDTLTGIHNSTYLVEYFDVLTLNNINDKIGVIYIDLDNFKYINDVFGHDKGDKLLIEIAKRLCEIEDEDKAMVCRNGGDEFTILYKDMEDKVNFEKYLDKVINIINEDYFLDSVKANVSASIGVANYPNDGKTFNEIKKAVDIATSYAKEHGKNTVQYFNNEMKNEILELINIENDLRAAVANKEFVLYYQPQYDIDSGKLCGFEALIRWISPTRGFVPPVKFIPQAEKNQLIIPIGTWALEEACDFINEIREKTGVTDFCISVNVSVVQMMCDDYVEKTMEILKRKKIHFENIKLEITESVMMESVDDMILKVNKLTDHGVYFALDDFGTGYSSLTYLKKIPLKVLKIDKSFVDTLEDDGGNDEILSSIIGLAHDINLDVVAEGIEEDSQLQWLKNKGCNIAQGFYMGKPMPKEQALKEIGKNMYL
ncbi:MAG: EAL domain-containing protein [Firmicutes bacterium]|nr:EAL domain-containing protein [Bacillota bacterium]